MTATCPPQVRTLHAGSGGVEWSDTPPDDCDPCELAPNILGGLRWRCAEGHCFHATYRQLSLYPAQLCPRCRVVELAALAAKVRGGSCVYATFIRSDSIISEVQRGKQKSYGAIKRPPKGPPPEPPVATDEPELLDRRHDPHDLRRQPSTLVVQVIPSRPAPPRPVPSRPILSSTLVVQVGWRCPAGHEWATYERLGVNGQAQLGLHPPRQAPLDYRACSTCMRERQQSLFDSARASVERAPPERDGGGGAPPPPAAADVALPKIGTAREELARILALPPSAHPEVVLGLPAGVSTTAARRRYRQLARLIHPDKCLLLGTEEAFKRLGAALQRLDSPLVGSAGARRWRPGEG